MQQPYCRGKITEGYCDSKNLQPSPTVYCLCTAGTLTAKQLLLYSTSTGQAPEAPWKKGTFVPFPHDKGAGLPEGLLTFALVIYPPSNALPPCLEKTQ